MRECSQNSLGKNSWGFAQPKVERSKSFRYWSPEDFLGKGRNPLRGGGGDGFPPSGPYRVKKKDFVVFNILDKNCCLC